jgi:small subunit ribosomal protein S16
MVRIRLKRTGRTHRISFRVTVVDRRASRDGNVLEELGYYDPANKNPELRLKLKRERIEYWLSKGAQATETVQQLLAKPEAAVAAK